jgi:hypothetical protein
VTLVVNGADAPGDEKFGRDAKLKEELERNKMVGLPSEERSGGGRYLRSTPAGRLPGGAGVRSKAAARFAGRAAQQGGGGGRAQGRAQLL